jgi:uncharacterized protein (DUF2342 family)
MSQESYEWWTEYINNYESDAEKITELAAELEIDESEIYDRINDFVTNDMNDEHDIKQNVIAGFRNRD